MSKAKSPALKLVEVQCRIGPITTREVNQTEEGHKASVRVALALTIDAAELGNLPEAKALAILAKCGDGVDADAKHTTTVKMRRSWAGHVFTVVDPDDGARLEFRGEFKTAEPRFVRGDVELRIAVDTVVSLADVATMQALMVSECQCSTAEVQQELNLAGGDDTPPADKPAKKPLRRQARTKAESQAAELH